MILQMFIFVSWFINDTLIKYRQHLYNMHLFLARECTQLRVSRIWQEVVQWLRLALSKGPNWVGVFSPPSPEDGKRSSFRNVVVFWNIGWRKKSRKILWILYNCPDGMNSWCTKQSMSKNAMSRGILGTFWLPLVLLLLVKYCNVLKRNIP
jgi:hypothetical protein